MVNSWAQIKDNWYLFGTDGKMMTGWAKVDNDYYYLNTDGRMMIDWLTDSEGNKYYMDNTNGKMSKGWKQIGDAWYYFSDNGHMMTKWIQISGKYYYLIPPPERWRPTHRCTSTEPSIPLTPAASARMREASPPQLPAETVRPGTATARPAEQRRPRRERVHRRRFLPGPRRKLQRKPVAERQRVQWPHPWKQRQSVRAATAPATTAERWSLEERTAPR